MASSLTLNWAALLAILGGLFTSAGLALVWVIRNGHNRRVRFGVFVERETDEQLRLRLGPSEADTEIRAADGD